MKVQGRDALERKWGKVAGYVRIEVRAAMVKFADAVVADMKRAAPRDESKLANSIDWTWGAAPDGSLTIGSVGGGDDSGADGRLRITFYAGDETTVVTNSRGIRFQNARLQEFGTTNMPAHPYFYPVWRIWRRRFAGRLRSAVRRGVKKAMGA